MSDGNGHAPDLIRKVHDTKLAEGGDPTVLRLRPRSSRPRTREFAPQDDLPSWVSELAGAWNRAARAESEVAMFKEDLVEIAKDLQAQEKSARAAQQAALSEAREATVQASRAEVAAARAAEQVDRHAANMAAEQEAAGPLEMPWSLLSKPQPAPESS